MKSVGRPKHSVINVSALVLIYFLLCFLTFLFSHTFFSEVLRDGGLPGPLSIAVFAAIPGVLFIFLCVSFTRLLRDLAARRMGSKFQLRLLAYFITIVLFAAAPVTVISVLSVNEVVRYWRGINAEAAMDAAQDFALEAYTLHAEKFQRIIDSGVFDTTAADIAMPDGVDAWQDFIRDPAGSGEWESADFVGRPDQKLRMPPSRYDGMVSRQIPRDSGHLRYVLFPWTLDGTAVLRVVSYSLGDGFDEKVALVEEGKARFDIIDNIRRNLIRLFLFYYFIFFFPSLLMTLIIALSFTRRVTAPIVELTEATRRVAEGDFSIQILSRRGDELGLLIRSFNAMVRDLEKTQAALVKTETISVWQTMAQQLAHEIKNPLTPIRLSAERVLRRWRNEPETIGDILESSMMAIVQETEGLSTLLTEFRTLSKPAEPSQSWTQVREAVVESTSPYISSHPDIRFDISHVDDTIQIKIDKHRLIQVFTNLIINGIDAMNGKGDMEIRTDTVKKRDAAFCRISVKDSGKGIPAENGQLVFTPYFTTKESGTGLGLPIVERIVSDHGGAIWFNSAEGAGTTFFIDLPVDSGERAMEGGGS